MAKRISSSSANWAFISKCVPNYIPPEAYTAFKAKSDKFLRRVSENAAELPKIDWAYYNSLISKPGMVESLRKGYEAVKISYPTDQGFLAKIDKQEAENKQENLKKREAIQKDVSVLEAKLKELNETLPYSEMTIEEFYVACPERAFDYDNPTLFPHGDEVYIKYNLKSN